MNPIVSIISMLHEPTAKNSATRLFHSAPVLTSTLKNLQKVSRIQSAFILCWDDQSPAIHAAISSSQDNYLSPSPGTPEEGRGEGINFELRNQNSESKSWPHPNPLPEYRARELTGCTIACKGRRQHIATLDAISAAGRWLDGWRGGLLQSCDFDLGFHGPWIAELAGAADVLLIDPAAGLLQPTLVEKILDRAQEQPDLDMAFSPVAPGLTAVFIKNSLLVQLAAANQHPGKLLHYLPQRPSRDPIGGEACVEVPVQLARTTQHFKLNSRRQINWLENAIDSRKEVGVDDLIQLASAKPQAELPRDITLELTTRRSTFPAFGVAKHFPFTRPDLTLETTKKVFAELSDIDDLRLTLGGVGDPLCHPRFFDIVEAARAAGIAAVHVETDLYDLDSAQVAGLVEAGIDILSVNLPAATPKTYQKLMGIDGYETVLQNIKQLVLRRQSLSRGTPIVVPTFAKCRLNFTEMESWYDQWIIALGVAVITGAGNCESEPALTDIAPPKRKPCARLNQRMTILSDGQVVSCEMDVAARQALGQINHSKITHLWSGPAAALRVDHENGTWQKHPVCSSCKEWHRS